MANLLEYTKWEKVPEHLKTKTQLNNIGLRLSKGQEKKAEFCSYIRGKNRPTYYNLYDVSEAEEKAKASPKQLETLAKARQTRKTCKVCNQVKHLSEIYKRVCDKCRHQRFLHRHRLEAIQWAKLATLKLIEGMANTATDKEAQE